MPAITDRQATYGVKGLDRGVLTRGRVEKERADSRAKSKNRARTETRTTRPAISGFAIFSSVVVFAMLLALLFSYVDLSEVSDLNRQKKIELQKLQEENQMLEITYNQRVGTLKVREYAVTRLGMSKIDKSQIRYVETPYADVFEVTGGEKKSSNGIVAGIADCFSTIVEFIN